FYYRDFHSYLRTASQMEEYLKPPKSDPFAVKAAQMVQLLSTLFFTRSFYGKELLKFIGNLIELTNKRMQSLKELKSSKKLINNFHDDDAVIRFVLRHYPNGHLMKTLDLFKEDQELVGFDPLAQGNNPSLLFSFSNKSLHVSGLRLPAPIIKKFIRSA